MEILTKRWLHITIVVLLFIGAAVGISIGAYNLAQGVETVRFTAEQVGLSEQVTLVGYYNGGDVFPVNAAEAVGELQPGMWQDLFYNPHTNEIVGGYLMSSWGAMGIGIALLAFATLGCFLCRKKY